MKWIEFKGKMYPKFQSEGNAARWVMPFAQEVCKGKGLDIGFSKDEWKFPGAMGIDLTVGHDAMELPMLDEYFEVDYIFSSHCLEHLPDWVGALNHWLTRLKWDGLLFLYLPDYSQEYWRPWNNRKHIHALTPQLLTDYAKQTGYKYFSSTGADLNSSFTFIIQKSYI